MTEQEWLVSENPERMLNYLEVGSPGSVPGTVSDRKLRLFACACCRQVWDKITDDAPCPECGDESPYRIYCDYCGKNGCAGKAGRINRSRRAVEVAERYADGLATSKELAAAEEASHTAWSGSDNPAGAARYTCIKNVQHAVQCITRPQMRDLPPPATQATLLRCLVGNPFQPVKLPLSESKCSWCGNTKPCASVDCPWMPGKCPWLTHDDGAVVKLARVAYDERRWDLLPLIADALEEAECKNEAILGHLRNEFWCVQCGAWRVPDLGRCNGCGMTVDREPRSCRGWLHVRGCWVLDLLLGLE